MFIKSAIYWIKEGYYYLISFLPEITYDIEIDHTDEYLKVLAKNLERWFYLYITRYIRAYIVIFNIHPAWVFSCSMILIIIGPSCFMTTIRLLILLYVVIFYGSIIILNLIKKNYNYYYDIIKNKLKNVLQILFFIITLKNKIVDLFNFIFYYIIDIFIFNNIFIKKGIIKYDIYGNELILIKKSNIFFNFSLFIFTKLSSYVFHLFNFRTEWRSFITYSTSETEGEPEYTKDFKELEDHIICFPIIEGLKIKHKVKKLKLKFKVNKLKIFKKGNMSIKYGFIRILNFKNFLINKSFILFIFKNFKSISILLIFYSFIFSFIINICLKILNFFNRF